MAERFPTRVLLATDGSEDAAAATWAAAHIARRSGAELHLVHVSEFVAPREFVGVALRLKSPFVSAERGRQLLEEQEAIVREAGGAVAVSHLKTGPPVEGILKVCYEVGADLVVVGSRGLGGVKRLLLGSVSEGLVHHARCPVLVMRPGGEEAWPPGRIVVADDGSEFAEQAGRLAAAIGSLFGARLTLAQVYPRFLESTRHSETPEGDLVRDALGRVTERMEQRAARLEPILGSRPTVDLLADEGSEDIDGIAMTLLDTAAEAASETGELAMISIGSRGLGTSRRLLIGSVSTKVVRAAAGPVLVCPSPTKRARARAGNAEASAPRVATGAAAEVGA